MERIKDMSSTKQTARTAAWPASMTAPVAEASPRSKAMIAGVFCLLTVLNALGLFLRSRLVLLSDAAATGPDIVAYARILRFGLAVDLIAFGCCIACAALLYELFEPVNRKASLLATSFSLMAAAVRAFACLIHLALLILFGAARTFSVFRVEQLRALVLMVLELHSQAYTVSLVFFGFLCLLTGSLILWLLVPGANTRGSKQRSGPRRDGVINAAGQAQGAVT